MLARLEHADLIAPIVFVAVDRGRSVLLSVLGHGLTAAPLASRYGKAVARAGTDGHRRSLSRQG